MKPGDMMQGGRPAVNDANLPPAWLDHLQTIKRLDEAYQNADVAANTFRDAVAKERNIAPTSITPARYPEYKELAQAREQARVDRKEAMAAAVDAGVSMYRIAKWCGFKSGAAHVANVLRSSRSAGTTR